MTKRSLSNLALVPFLLLTLQSCFTAKNYVRPDLIQEEYYRTDQLPADSLSLGDLSWRELFTDPWLTEYIETGLENNLDIRIALQQIEAAEAFYRQGRASRYPGVSAGAGAGWQRLAENGPAGTSGDATQFDLSATLSWELDIWGKLRSGERASEASYLQTVAAHQAVKTSLIARIASTYYRLLMLDEQLRITEQTIATRQRSLETTMILKEAGYVTEAGVKQTEAQLYTAMAIRIDLINNIRLLENTFSILLGEAPREIPRGNLADQQLSPELKTGYPMQLLRNRPDVIAAEYALVEAFELVNVARSQFYPSINLTASTGLQSLELEDLFNAGSFFAGIAGSLTQPIFNGRRIRSQYEASLSMEEQAALRFRQSILNASREVSDALYSYQSAEERIEMAGRRYQAYEDAARYAEELLNNGLVNYLEVLTAQEQALNTRLELIGSQFDRLDSVVELYRALGGGWN